MDASDYYVPTKRSGHSTHIVGDYLYMWGGVIDGLPKVHDNEIKQRMTSVIEVFHLPSGMWEQQPTNGKPPLGVDGYASTVISNRIYYFGGYCNHDECRHNTLNSLTTDSFTWNEQFPTNPSMSPMMKSGCRMISLTFNKEDYLLVFGGWGPRPPSEQPGAQYMKAYGDNVRTNEHHYYQISSGHWRVPDVIGNPPPPCNHFTLTSLPNNRALLFGGYTPDISDESVYIVQCTKTAVHWEKLNEPLPELVNWPQSRWDHAATIIGYLHVLILGGYSSSDCWLFNISTKTWTMLTLPESVTKRWYHSLSVWSMSSNVVRVVQFGGYRHPHKLNDTTLIDLICDNDQWSVRDIIANLKSTEEYQLKLQQKRQEMSVQTPLIVQLPTSRPLSFSPYEVSHEKDKEIQRLTQLLKATSIELEDTKQQLIDVSRALQEDLQTKEVQLHQLHQQLQKKEELISELQQNQAELQIEHENRERLLTQQLQDQEERERQQLQVIQERERLLSQQHGNVKQDVCQQIQESTNFQHSHWVVMKDEIEITDEILGKGGWGEVKVAKFRGLRVAAKCLHEVILSSYNISVFTREMEIAARVRHPNLLQFIGATQVGTPIILSELMPSSLRKELEAGPLPYHAVLTISKDIACGINYLHLFKPHPILHRDVSTANILLTHGQFGWRAKVSDYGSANLQPMIGHTIHPGNPIYSAPEAGVPREHSPAMDVYSYGVVLIEMIIRRIPDIAERHLHINAIKPPMFKALIERCLKENRRERPTMSEIITDLNGPFTIQ